MDGGSTADAPSVLDEREGGLKEEACLADLAEALDGAEDSLGELVLRWVARAGHGGLFGVREGVDGAEGHGANA